MWFAPPLLFLSALLIFTSLALSITESSSPPRQTTYLFYRSLAPNAPKQSPFFPDLSSYSPLATLTYAASAPHNARIASLTLPPNNTELTSIALFSPSDPKPWRSTATSTRGFHAPFKGRFRLMVSVDGRSVLSASYHSFYPSETTNGANKGNSNSRKGVKDANGAEEDREDFDIVFQKKAPVPYLEKPARKGQRSIGITMPEENEEGEVQEKTFLQKYWWLLLGVLVIVLLGPGEK